MNVVLIFSSNSARQQKYIYQNAKHVPKVSIYHLAITVNSFSPWSIDHCCPVLCRYLSEGGPLHSRQCVQHPATTGVFSWIPEQMLLSEAWGHVVFATSTKGEHQKHFTPRKYLKNRQQRHSSCLRINLERDHCVLQNNVMVFVAELFWWFESVKPDFVQPRDLHEIRDGITQTRL